MKHGIFIVFEEMKCKTFSCLTFQKFCFEETYMPRLHTYLICFYYICGNLLKQLLEHECR